MITLDQCLKANRPLLFILAEHDLELLKHLNTNYQQNFFVYSTTLMSAVPLPNLLTSGFVTDNSRAQSTLEILDTILQKNFDPSERVFEKYIFLDAQTILHDAQNIRKIKDIVSRYQLDENFVINLIFISQSVCVPPQLERLSEVVFFDLPNEDQLKEINDSLTKKLELDKAKNVPSEEVVNNLKGLTLFEVEQAYLQNFTTTKDATGVGKIELEFIREFKKSIIAKTDLLSLMEANITFDDIGGLDRLKQWVKKSYGGWTVEGKKYGLPILKGILMIGPSGTGKSLMMKAIGNEWKLPVIVFGLSRVFSSQVGESETNIRRVLKIIEATAPCLCVVDEMEKAFAGIQSSTFSDSGVTARILGVFLSWMQDCEKPIFIAGTCNDISYLPPELISRFDEIFFVNLPHEQERWDIFSIQLKKVGRDPSKFDVKKLAEISKDFTGREIEQVVKESLYDAFHEGIEVTTNHILEVISKKTNITTTFSERLRALYKWVGWNNQKKDGIRARFASVPDEMDVARIQSEIDKLIDEIGSK